MNLFKSYQFIPKQDIEKQAEELRLKVESKRSRRLRPDSVAEAVADFLDLGIVWQKIEPDSDGQIAAMILPTQREIVINEAIEELRGGFGQSTIAHEIGHWVLHINQNAVGQFREPWENLSEQMLQPFLCRSVNSGRGIEWQAQYFAGCLLMPQSLLCSLQRGRDLTNWKHLYAMRDELGVTISNLLNRLKDLDWIVHTSGSKQLYLGKAAPSRTACSSTNVALS